MEWDIRRDCLDPLLQAFGDAAQAFDDYQSSDAPISDLLHAMSPIASVSGMSWGLQEIGTTVDDYAEIIAVNGDAFDAERAIADTELAANAAMGELWLRANLSDGIGGEFRKVVGSAASEVYAGINCAQQDAERYGSDEPHKWSDGSAMMVWNALTRPTVLIGNIIRILDPPKADRSRNPERDEFIVRRHNEGSSYKAIIAEIKKHPEWYPIHSVPGVKAVVDRRQCKRK